uniref:uncharacterized protein LOC122583734 n=1 Tax=Erigeron canadensis TaxID=72917 RepID=UPI001CB8C40D|nr:uncharacterized protein LOC122583734 [Erigeron canadensis]
MLPLEPGEAMPWVGTYIWVASLVCTLAMGADVFHGFRLGKLWFPCRFFTVNAVSITVIAITMKLPLDLNAITNSDILAKNGSICFLVTMVANFLPSLGLMGDKELLINIIAFGILLITILVNVWILAFSWAASGFAGMFILPCLLTFSVALTVPASRRNLELQYKELRRLAPNHDEMNFSYEELVSYVKMYWMMAETGNPQFVIACSQISFTLGVLCFVAAIMWILYPDTYSSYTSNQSESSDYKRSLGTIFLVQLLGVSIGCLAPIFRCFTVISYFKPSKKWSKNHLNVFIVEKQWIERLQQWKGIHVRSHIPGRHCKKVFHMVKNMILNICISLQIVVAVICKSMCLVPRCFLMLFSYCWYLCISLSKRFKWRSRASNDYISDEEVKKFSKYVLLAEKEAKLSERILKNMLISITKIIRVSAKKEPANLLTLLDKSKGFNGVAEFDDDEVPPLYPEETHNCWSLVAVTLTTIAIALPNISNSHVKDLLASMQEGLQIVRYIEESLNENVDLVDASKAAGRLWTEVEVYKKWLQIDIQKKSSKGKPSKKILQCFGDEAVKNMMEFKRSDKESLNHSFHTFITSSSMYRISQTILLRYNKLEDWPNDEEIFEWISQTIADMLCACFTNLPRVIKMKCHHDAIEKRGDNIRIAAQLLGKSKNILKILKERQLPNLDMDSMAYINKWQAIIPKSDIPNYFTSSTRVQLTSWSSNESLVVTVM